MHTGCGVHLPAVLPEAAHQPSVVLVLTNTGDIQEVRIGRVHRPMGSVEPVGPPGSRAVLLLDTIARGARADASPPRDRLEPYSVGVVRADVGFYGDRQLTPPAVPSTLREAMSHISVPGSGLRTARTPVRNQLEGAPNADGYTTAWGSGCAGYGSSATTERPSASTQSGDRVSAAASPTWEARADLRGTSKAPRPAEAGAAAD